MEGSIIAQTEKKLYLSEVQPADHSFMAISRIQPMLLLLASLFFFPSLDAANFLYCNGEGYVYGNITRVDVSPNPVGGGDEPTITLFGFAYNSSATIYRGKIEVYIYLTTPWGTDAGRTLVTKRVDENDGIIEHGKSFKLSVRVPASTANMGEAPVSVTLIDERPIYDDKPVPQKRLCFQMFLPSKNHPMPSSSS